MPLTPDLTVQFFTLCQMSRAMWHLCGSSNTWHLQCPHTMYAELLYR